MAAGRPTFGKRNRERSRDQKKKDKEARIARQRAERKARREAVPDDVDPDIAHITPGVPQAQPWMEALPGDPSLEEVLELPAEEIEKAEEA